MLILDTKIPYISMGVYESIKDRLVILFSASKTFGMSGYRTGAILGPSQFINAINQVVRFSVQAAPTIGQMAFLEALNFNNTGEWVNKKIEIIRKRANYINNNLERFTKIKSANPESGVFLFPFIKNYGMSSFDFCMHLLTKSKVFALPGIFYGKNADGFIRLSLSVSEQNFYEGFQRFFDFINELESK